MSKIKEISISNFRAYLGEHKFSFIGKNGVSNLIVIYGPNGFGKTSFFDAVEFTLSDSIRRFENKITKAEIESRDYATDELILLSHRDSKVQAEVKILTNDDKLIKRVALRRKLPNGPYTDYKRGVLQSDIPEIDLKSIYNTNLLSQDQIDNFLRLLTPEEKFNELQEFWPQGAEAAAVFKDLSKYRRLLKSSLLETEKFITNVETEIKKYLNPEEKLEVIRRQVLTFNENKLFALLYPELDGEITESLYSGLIELNDTNKKLINNRIDDSRKLQIDLDNLIEEHPSYLQNLKSIQDERSKKKKISELKGKNIVLAKLRDQKNSNARKNEEIKLEITKSEALIAEWPAHWETLSVIVHLQSEIDTRLRQTELALNNIRVYDESHRTLQYSCNELRTELASALRLDDKMYALEAGLKKNAADAKEGLEILEYIEGVELEINADIERLQSLKFELQAFRRNYEDPTSLSEFQYYQEIYRINQINLVQVTGEFNELNQERDLQASFTERLDSILEWGLAQVEAKQLSSCPMCNTQFSDVSALLLGMESDRATLLNSSTINKKITETAIIRQFLQEEEFFLKCQMEELAKRLIETTSKTIDIAHSHREHIYNRKADVENKINFAVGYSDRVLNELQVSGLPVQEYQQDFSELRDHNNQRILKLRISIDRLEKVIRFKLQQKQLLDVECTLSKLQTQTNSNKIDILQAEITFQNFQMGLSDFHLKADQMHFEILEDWLAKLAKNLHDLILIQEKLENEITLLTNELESDPVKYQIEISELHIQELDSKVDYLQDAIKLYHDKYRLMSDDETLSIETIINISESFKARLSGLNNLITDLETFTISLEVIRENLELGKLKTELKYLNTKKEHIIIAKGKVKQAHVECGEFINSGIDEYFNKDVINRIYSKIEPHPSLKQIEIKSEISEDDKAAKLQIRARNKNELLNPIFYFSTGQVNVLSLSIFLAKAFELGSESINTVFMDDPVQNLSDINVLSFIDLLRTLIEEKDRQIVISTHDEKFFRLLQNKLSDEYFKAKYIELISYGQIKDETNANTIF